MALSIRSRKIILLSLLVIGSVTLIGLVLWFFSIFSSDLFGSESNGAESTAMLEIESVITPVANGGLLEEEAYSAPIEPTAELVEFETQGLIETAPAVVDHFLIEGFPTRIEQGVAVSFEVIPVDINGNYVEFLGEVYFESLDPNAVLPEMYDFSQSEGLTVVFESGVAFDSLGVQSFKVIASDDRSIQGEVLIAVVPNKKPIEILLPQPGEVSDLQLVIRGETQQGINKVNIYDGGRAIARNVEVGANGSFIFVTGFLNAGTHKFKIIDAMNDAVISDVVVVNVKRD